MAHNVLFSISTQMEMEGRQLKAVKPNRDGVYEGIPLAVIGCSSRNGVNYERESVMRCLTDIEGRFAANVQTGDMEGEWGHPLIKSNWDKAQVLDRLLRIERTLVSHYFTKIYGKDVGNGLVMVYGNVKPFGPYGPYLKESFEDPLRNTSFSLRSAASRTGEINGVVQKKMLALVTFDAVDGPGFLKASKRFQDQDVVSSEGYKLTIDPVNHYDIELSVDRKHFLDSQESLKLSGLESLIDNQQILDAFGCDKIKIKDALVTRDGENFMDIKGQPASVFDMCFNA